MGSSFGGTMFPSKRERTAIKGNNVHGEQSAFQAAGSWAWERSLTGGTAHFISEVRALAAGIGPDGDADSSLSSGMP